jgi:hypothetical protein
MEIRPTYFPSVLDLSAAQEIRVQPGVDQSGFDIRLQAAAVYRLRGVVLDPEGHPAAKAVVELLSKTIYEPRGFVSFPFGPFEIASGALGSGTQYALIEPEVTKSDGSFEFASVPEGGWILRAESDTVRDTARQRDLMLYGTEEVRLGRRDVDDVAIRLLPPFDLGVSVELAGGSGAPDIQAGAQELGFQIMLTPLDGAGRGIISRPPEAGRAWRAENLQPGAYRIRAQAFSNGPYYVASILLGGTDVTGQVVQLSPTSSPMRVILKPAATLRGMLKQGGGATIVVWRQSTLVGEEGKSASCAADGSFEIRGLAPGDYYAVAVERFDLREVTSLPYLRAMIPRAARVQLEEGATEFVELDLTR